MAVRPPKLITAARDEATRCLRLHKTFARLATAAADPDLVLTVRTDALAIAGLEGRSRAPRPPLPPAPV